MTVWRVRMVSGLAGVDVHASKRFALRNNLVCTGWGLDGHRFGDMVPDGCTDPDRYFRVAREKFPNDKSLEPAWRRLALEMEIGDVCWTYETATQTFWSGIVTGPFIYRQGGSFDEYDLHMTRACDWEFRGQYT